MNYSKVDMTLNGGLGEVVASEKNVLIFKSTCEKLSVTSHANGTDYWVVGYKAGTDSIFTILVDQNGVGQPQ